MPKLMTKGKGHDNDVFFYLDSSAPKKSLTEEEDEQEALKSQLETKDSELGKRLATVRLLLVYICCDMFCLFNVVLHSYKLEGKSCNFPGDTGAGK